MPNDLAALMAPVRTESSFDVAQAAGETLLKSGYLRLAFADRTPIDAIRAFALDFLRAGPVPDLARLEDYHHHVLEDDRHTDIQGRLADAFWASGLGPQIVEKNATFFRMLVGIDLHVQRYPYLRIARPNKPQDNVGFHRDTHYGSSPYELSCVVPFTDVGLEGSLAVIPGSHVEPDSAYPWTKRESETVTKGSEKHTLGFVYAPKDMGSDIASKATAINTQVGEGLLFSLSIVHGQEVNRSAHTRFSTDVRVVNSLAPIAWERSVRADYYRPLAASGATAQARQYLEIDAADPNKTAA